MTDICFGLNNIQTIMATEPKRIIELLIQEGRNDNRIKLLKLLADENKIQYKFVNKSLLNQLTTGTHQGVVAKVTAIAALGDKDLMSILDQLTTTPLLLILDGITDPHNLGACLRTACAAGVNAVIIPKNKSAWLNETATKVASGAAEFTPLIRVTNLSRTIEQLKKRGIWTMGAVCNEHAESVYTKDLTIPLAIIIGAEDKGIRKLTQDKCDHLIYIPIDSKINSLNVSVASGVVLFEAIRQRAYQK